MPVKNTVVGARCFIMAGAHVAHDCVVADDVVLANNVLLAGHVVIGPFTFVGGGAAIHQFCRIGEGAMVGGLGRVTLDVPPFTMIAERDDIIGFNVVGLKRRGFARETIRELKEVYRTVYGTPGNIRNVAASLLATAVSAEARRFLEFFTQGKRGVARPSRTVPADAEES
jgi:UDP-N-acetylglucosamine acyltransferase